MLVNSMLWLRSQHDLIRPESASPPRLGWCCGSRAGPPNNGSVSRHNGSERKEKESTVGGGAVYVHETRDVRAVFVVRGFP
ncbi:hypothetical protein GW17_00048883 [Ensete ventricosum]|nr:hypothetical protein GW17_00048883 [Ensete ventricosum]RZS11449.1 hypothetical protein BHM03_00042781 [Ensete ventricosum]